MQGAKERANAGRTLTHVPERSMDSSCSEARGLPPPARRSEKGSEWALPCVPIASLNINLEQPMNASLRICFVAHNAYGALSGVRSGHVGGIERQQALMAKWLAGRGH